MNLDHLPPMIRDKVEGDLVVRTDPDGGFSFNVGNDYQVHLYALYLKLKGKTKEEIVAALLSLPLYVLEHKKEGYVDDIVHSVIVGFPNPKGELLPVWVEVK